MNDTKNVKDIGRCEYHNGPTTDGEIYRKGSLNYRDHICIECGRRRGISLIRKGKTEA